MCRGRGSDVVEFFFKIWHETINEHKEGWEGFSSRSIHQEKIQKIHFTSSLKIHATLSFLT